MCVGDTTIFMSIYTVREFFRIGPSSIPTKPAFATHIIHIKYHYYLLLLCLIQCGDQRRGNL